MHAPILIATDKAQNLEAWAMFDEIAGVYEIFASANGDDYMGTCDTIAQCKLFARDYFADQACF